MDLKYSLDGCSYFDLEDILDEAEALGGNIDVYVGRPSPFKHSEFFNIPIIIEDAKERAYEEALEHTGEYLENLTGAEYLQFEEAMNKFLDGLIGPVPFGSVEFLYKTPIGEI